MQFCSFIPVSVLCSSLQSRWHYVRHDNGNHCLFSPQIVFWGKKLQMTLTWNIKRILNVFTANKCTELSQTGQKWKCCPFNRSSLLVHFSWLVKERFLRHKWSLLLYIFTFELHYTSIKCAPTPGRKDGLLDRVEGGLNTSVLMTPCWDHLFPDKRAQGWEKKEDIRRPVDIGRVARGGSRWWNAGVCVCVCAHLDRWVHFICLCVLC